jgi:SAM-dependent methyltransferase
MPFQPTDNPRFAETQAEWLEARQRRLQEFVRWRQTHIQGDEKGEAQIFIDRLFQAFGHQGCLEVGGHPEFRVRKAADSGRGTSFADYVWKPVVLIEMKKRGENLAKHYRQAFDYWARLVPNRPTYAILCNFDEFWIYDFSRQMDAPVDRVSVLDLPSRFGALAFLFPGTETPTFGDDHVAVTTEAAAALAACHHSLIDRGVDSDHVRHFTLQMLVALFSEDIELLPKYLIPHLLADCTSPAKAFDLLGDLFEWMNTPGVVDGGRYKGVPYFNGGLFSRPVRLELQSEEVELLRKAATYDWSKVSPDIFGTIFEASLAQIERHAFGAYFTSPVDIMKIVGPTIVDPWRREIDSARTPRDLEALLLRMRNYRVLDPACGSGNFLYVAYRELKRLEARIYERRSEMTRSADQRQGRLRFVGTSQFFGIDINPFAVELAKVTLMVAHKLVIDELGVLENALPLDNLDANFIAADALVDENRRQRVWPTADVIIGNPPFLGSKRLKPERGANYVNALRRLYPDIPAMADYCVYWFRRAHDNLQACTAEDPLRGRAGLVGTQNIRSQQSRVGGLDHIAATGTIVDAVDNQPWSGDSAVHVAIVNWIKTTDPKASPGPRYLWTSATPRATKRSSRRGDVGGHELHRIEVPSIGSSLSADATVGEDRVLACNREPKRCFQGKIPGYDGFLIGQPAAGALRRDSAAVIYPYLTGRELLNDFRIERWIIDFGARNLHEAAAFRAAFEHCQAHVLPKVEATYLDAVRNKSDMVAARKEHRERWWQLWNRRDELTAMLRTLPRYIGCSRVTRRPIMAFISPLICPSDLVQVFSFADDYSFGVLQSSLHFEWFKRRSSRLKVESDMRYSVRDVFETFPWPQGPEFTGPTDKQVGRVAAAAQALRQQRVELLVSARGGLRSLYRTLDLPGKSPLRDAHDELDAAVYEAYGFTQKRGGANQLADLNRSVAERLDHMGGVVSPGVPPLYSRTASLISDDCYEA